MGRYFSLLDMAIAGVPVILFCVWQLVSVNREIAKDKKPPEAESDEPPTGRGRNV